MNTKISMFVIFIEAIIYEALHDTIWYYLCDLKKVKNTHGGVLLLVKLLAKASNLTKSNTPPWVFFFFKKLCKRYQVAERSSYICYYIICMAVPLSQLCLLVCVKTCLLKLRNIFNPLMHNIPKWSRTP